MMPVRLTAQRPSIDIQAVVHATAISTIRARVLSET